MVIAMARAGVLERVKRAATTQSLDIVVFIFHSGLPMSLPICADAVDHNALAAFTDHAIPWTHVLCLLPAHKL